MDVFMNSAYFYYCTV